MKISARALELQLFSVPSRDGHNCTEPNTQGGESIHSDHLLCCFAGDRSGRRLGGVCHCVTWRNWSGDMLFLVRLAYELHKSEENFGKIYICDTCGR